MAYEADKRIELRIGKTKIRMLLGFPFPKAQNTLFMACLQKGQLLLGLKKCRNLCFVSYPVLDILRKVRLIREKGFSMIKKRGDMKKFPCMIIDKPAIIPQMPINIANQKIKYHHIFIKFFSIEDRECLL